MNEIRAQFGAVVVAAKSPVTEEGYRDVEEFVHAEPGDLGEVLETLNDEGQPFYMVHWYRTDSIAQVVPEEICGVV